MIIWPMNLHHLCKRKSPHIRFKIETMLFLAAFLFPTVIFSAAQELDLFSATTTGNLAQVKYLLLSQQGAVNSSDSGGFSPLMYAVWNKHTVLAELLLEKKAEVNTASKDGHTALIIASANGHESLVPKILDLKADIHAFNKQGWTPLNCASRNGHLSITNMLLSVEVDINQVDATGKKAYALAEEKGHAQIISAINAHEQKNCARELAGMSNEKALMTILAAFWQQGPKE